MRSAETISDSKQVIATNPVEKISLSKHSLTPRGVQQAMSAADALMRSGVKSDAWIWPSVTISAFETAEVVASKLRVRREQIVPEFSFLDARGVGALEGGDVTEVRDLLRKHDALDSNWKPVPGEDGTPNDSVEDVFVRVRQLISKLETQYFGETVVIVAPDSDPLTVLQTALTGRDVCTLHECEYEPGEVRRVSEMVMDQFGNVTTHGKVDVVFGGQA